MNCNELKNIFSKPHTLDEWQYMKDNLQTLSEIAGQMILAEESRQMNNFLGISIAGKEIENLIQQLPEELRWE